jgi:hypothetical protein
VAALQLPEQVDVRFQEGRFEDVFTGLLDGIESSGAQLAPTFGFIDPFGYTGNPMDLAGRFLAFQRCEALVYMPLPFVNRFVGREGQERALTALFGSERWKEALPYQGVARVQFLHELFQEQLRFGSSSRLVRSFEIPTAGGNGYRLYFTTGNEKGLEKMKEAMWRADPIGGERYQDTTDELILFEPEPDTSYLLDALKAHFGDRSFSIEDAERFTLLSDTCPRLISRCARWRPRSAPIAWRRFRLASARPPTLRERGSDFSRRRRAPGDPASRSMCGRRVRARRSSLFAHPTA